VCLCRFSTVVECGARVLGCVCECVCVCLCIFSAVVVCGARVFGCVCACVFVQNLCSCRVWCACIWVCECVCLCRFSAVVERGAHELGCVRVLTQADPSACAPHLTRVCARSLRL
jgi:hypothetical protein